VLVTRRRPSSRCRRLKLSSRASRKAPGRVRATAARSQPAAEAVLDRHDPAVEGTPAGDARGLTDTDRRHIAGSPPPPTKMTRLGSSFWYAGRLGV